MVSVGLDTLLRVAEESTGLDRAQVRFTGLIPVSPAVARHYLSTADYVRRGIYDQTLDHPLLLAAATVAAVAARWGYTRPRCFAAAYRQAYGQTPLRTLRS